MGRSCSTQGPGSVRPRSACQVFVLVIAAGTCGVSAAPFSRSPGVVAVTAAVASAATGTGRATVTFTASTSAGFGCTIAAAQVAAVAAAATRRRRRGRRWCRNVALLRRPVVVAVRRGGVRVHDDRRVFVQVVAGLRITRGANARARVRARNGARASATFVPRFPALSRQWRVPGAVRLVVHHLQTLPGRVQGRQRERYGGRERSQWRCPSGSGGGGGYGAWDAVVARVGSAAVSGKPLRRAARGSQPVGPLRGEELRLRLFTSPGRALRPYPHLDLHLAPDSLAQLGGELALEFRMRLALPGLP